MTRRVVVTGAGVVSPLGSDLETVWRRLRSGESGVSRPLRFARFDPPVRAIGEVAAKDVEALASTRNNGSATTDLRTLFALAAADEAWKRAGLSSASRVRGGVSMGSGPGAHRMEDFVRFSGADGVLDPSALARDRAEVHAGSLWRNPPERPAAEVAKRFGLGGPVRTVTSACSASLQAVGSALRDLRAGRADFVLAGGADSMVDPIGLVFFVLLGAAATEEGPKASRPFSSRRGGIVAGEGAVVFALETAEHARARGAKPIAEIAGYGAALDAYGTTAPHPDGRGVAAAMRRAIADAGLVPDDVDHVSAHATGTRVNDPIEARAIRDVLGERADRVAVSSTKSAVGHLLAASGGFALLSTVLAVANDEVAPTLHLDEVDPACELDHVRGTSRKTTVRAALVNALAFGGHDATIAVRKNRTEGPA